MTHRPWCAGGRPEGSAHGTRLGLCVPPHEVLSDPELSQAFTLLLVLLLNACLNPLPPDNDHHLDKHAGCTPKRTE